MPDRNFASLVGRAWRDLRSLPFDDVCRMNGRFGLVGLLRAIYQANVLSPNAEGDFSLVMQDAARVLRAMRDASLDNRTPGTVVAAPGTVLEVLLELDLEATEVATAAINRIAGDEPEVIDIEDEAKLPPPPLPSPKKVKKRDDDNFRGASGSAKSSGSASSSQKRKASGSGRGAKSAKRAKA